MSLQITVAAPFRHLHKEQLQRSEFIFYLAIDRGWMSRDKASALMERAVTDGLLELQGGLLVPRFPLEEVVIPLGYRPGSDDLEQPDSEHLLLARIAQATGMDERELAAEAHRLVTEGFDGQLRLQAALVLLARRHRVEFKDLLASLRSGILNE